MSDPGRLGALAALVDDPILLKELRAAFRRKRFFWLQTGLLALVAAILLLAMWWLTDDYRRDPSEIGRRTFLIFARLELGLIALVFPAFACTAITDERTNKSFDLLVTTKLSPSRIVLGKTLAAFVYGIQFIVATLPLVALTFLYGGVTPGQIVLTYAVMVLLAALVTVHALSVSSGAPSTIRAVLSTYFGLAFIVVPLAAPLVSTAPFFGFTGGGTLSSGGPLSGILAVHVFGPLSKDAGLVQLRDDVRSLDAFSSCVYWGGHAAFYASVLSLFFLIARHRLAPPSANRTTGFRAWFGTSLALALAGTLGTLIHGGLPRHPGEALVSILAGLFLVLSGAAVAFGGEDPEVPRRVRAAWERARGLRAPLRLLLPGQASGARFASWAAVLSFGTVLAVFLLLGLHDAPRETSSQRTPFTILAWGCAFGLSFVLFAAETSVLLACELRHAAAARLCTALALVALTLGPFLWYVLESNERRGVLYKGYALSPLTVAASLHDEPRASTRNLLLLGASGRDLLATDQALQRRFEEVEKPSPERPPATSRARSSTELARESVPPDLAEKAVALIEDALATAPLLRGPHDVPALHAHRDRSRERVKQRLAAEGVPVHEAATWIYAGLVLVLALVNRLRLRTAEGGRACPDTSG